MNNNNDNIFLTTPKQEGYDECLSKGICSISPSLSFLQEVILSLLKELSFYLLKLKELGINNAKIKENIIEVISSLIVNVDYNQEQFTRIITRLYGDLVQAKDIYISTCKNNNMDSIILKPDLKSPKFRLSDAIRQGQKLFNKRSEKYSVEQKKMFELILMVIKSICINLIELKELDVEDEKAYEAILALFNSMNSQISSVEKLREKIKDIVAFDYTLLQKLHEKREEKYGEIIPSEVSLSTRPNKAILVTGTNVRELELLLKATENKGIDVYTHGHMIMAHAFPGLKAYPHLVGHFGEGIETYLLDFAAFPGAIFMTRHSFQKVENLYRSSVFTTDMFAPKGVTTIKDNNFDPLIQAAQSAKGFNKGKESKSIKVDLHEKKILEKIAEVADKIEQKEIKHFFAVGVSNHTKIQKDYFEKFLKLLKDDCFALSFSYKNGKNVLYVESDYGFPILYKSLEVLTRKISIEELDPIILFTRCEIHTISNLLNLKFMGVNKIYFTDCSPHMVNPSLIETIREMFGVKKYTTPEADLKAMLAD